MASAECTAETKNFFRAFRLLVDVGTPVLKELFKYHAKQYGTIDGFLKNQSQKLKTYLQKNILQKHQYERIYPAGGGTLNMDSWDISLLCVLLTICCKLSPVEKRAVDTIRNKRNNEFCHTPNTSIDDAKFHALWNDLEREFINVLYCIKNVNFTKEVKDKITEIKEERIDGDDIGSLQGRLDKFQSKLDLLQGESDANQDQLKSLQDQTNLHQTQLESQQGQLVWHQRQLDRLNSMPETSTDDRVLRLQDYLLKAYTEYSKMNSFTIGPFKNVQVDNIYVEQNLDDVKSKFSTPLQNHDECFEATLQSSNFQHLFERFEERHLVIAGLPGGGKTTFCLKFISSWCSAVKKSQVSAFSLTQPEIKLLNRFRLLYFVSMQNEEDEVIEMIKNQIFSENIDLINDVESCFREIRDDCLVIIDGIDECHKLPRLNKLNFCKILWTARHSKLYRLSTLQNARILDIVPLNMESVRQLAYNLLIIIYKDPAIVEKKVQDFMNDLNKCKMQSVLAENPLILTYFIYHWYTEHGLENSMTLNYVGLLDLLLKINEDISAGTSQTGKSIPGMPNIFLSKSNIRQNVHLLHPLSKAAHHYCLLSQYVFEEKEVGKVIGKEHIGKCLKSGLLTKVPTSCHILSTSSFKFFHKTLQDLLAAVWICWKDKTSQNKLEAFLENYKTIEQILEISLILIFICGLDPKKAATISKHVATSALKEEEFKRYRRALRGRYSFRSSGEVSSLSTSYKKINCVQQMVIDCKEETNRNKHFKPISRHYIGTSFGSIFGLKSEKIIFPLHDIIIADKLNLSVSLMLKENTLNLRSIYTDLPKAENDVRIEDAICKTTKIERLHLDQTCSSVINKLSKLQIQSLRSLSLCLDNIDKLPENMNHLENISGLFLSISGTSHRMVEQLEQMLKTLINLEELELERIVCQEHRSEKQNCEFAMDLSNSNNLKKLKLENVCSSRTTLPSSVELDEVWISGSTSNAASCITRLSESESLSSIVLGDFKPFVWTKPDYLSITSELQKLIHLEYVYLVGINFERYGLVPKFNAQTKLKYLSLEYIQLSNPGWIMLLLSLVEYRDRRCEIKAEVQVLTIGIHNDIVSRIARKNAKKIVLDLKQQECRDKILGLKKLSVY